VRGFLTRIADARMTLPLCIGLPFCTALAVAAPCFAQTGGGPPPTGLGSLSQRNLGVARQGAAKGEIAPPPVLPGTKTAPDAVAPGSLPPDASPTDALFDAINRGDITAAREAVNRGANLNEHNILGETPLELSVDLGRNDISFMLLSMREGDSASRRITRTSTASTEPDATVTELARPTRRPVRSFVPAAAEAEEPAVSAPRFYSGNGGTAIPAAGFVGFGRSVR
jgi:hypothetical protein